MSLPPLCRCEEDRGTSLSSCCPQDLKPAWSPVDTPGGHPGVACGPLQQPCPVLASEQTCWLRHPRVEDTLSAWPPSLSPPALVCWEQLRGRLAESQLRSWGPWPGGCPPSLLGLESQGTSGPAHLFRLTFLAPLPALRPPTSERTPLASVSPPSGGGGVCVIVGRPHGHARGCTEMRL